MSRVCLNFPPQFDFVFAKAEMMCRRCVRGILDAFEEYQYYWTSCIFIYNPVQKRKKSKLECKCTKKILYVEEKGGKAAEKIMSHM